MKIVDNLRNAFRPSSRQHASDLTGRKHDAYRSAIGRGDVSFKRLIQRYKTDPLFHMIVNINTDYTAGRGYHLSKFDDSGKSEQALKLIEDWAEENDLDMILQGIAQDGWICGNAFCKWTTDGMIKKLPVSEFYQVNVDSEDNPVSYRRTRDGNSLTDVPASEILHFTFKPLDDTHFGEGIGQIMDRDGMGYTDPHDGTVRTRSSLFAINEMLTDVLSKMIYGGLPRFAVNVENGGKEVMNDLTKKMGKLAPLQHLVSNSKLDIKEVALSPSNKFDALFQHVNNQGVLASGSPLPTLWKDMSSFSYNSSENAIDSMIPEIDSFKRALRRFVERQIFKPILEVNGLEWKKHKVSLDWGPLDEPGMEDIKNMWDILKDPAFADRIDPADIITMLQELGYPIKTLDPKPREEPDPKEAAEMAADTFKHSIEGQKAAAELETLKAKQDAYNAVKERYNNVRKS